MPADVGLGGKRSFLRTLGVSTQGNPFQPAARLFSLFFLYVFSGVGSSPVLPWPVAALGLNRGHYKRLSI